MCTMPSWMTDELVPLGCEISQSSVVPANARAERLSISSTTTRSWRQLYIGPESSMRDYPLKGNGNRMPGQYTFNGYTTETATLRSIINNPMRAVAPLSRHLFRAMGFRRRTKKKSLTVPTEWTHRDTTLARIQDWALLP
jgi:hypothetical protein